MLAGGSYESHRKRERLNAFAHENVNNIFLIRLPSRHTVAINIIGGELVSRSRLSYEDAVRLLGHDKSKLAQLVDKLSASVLIGGVATGHVWLSAFFEFRAEAVRLGGELMSSIRERTSGRSRYEQAELLVAAHAVLVVTSYFEAFDRLGLPFSTKELKLSSKEMMRLSGSPVETYREFTDALISLPVPMPSPIQPYEAILEELRGFYKRLSQRFSSFIQGLSFETYFDETRLALLGRRILSEMPSAALSAYKNNYIRLAAECNEFFIWANLQEHHATRHTVQTMAGEIGERLRQLYSTADDLRTGLAGLEQFYTLAGVRSVEFAKSSLAIAGRSELNWPILDSQSLDAHYALQFPRLGAAYINPGGRIAEMNPESRPGDESWWSNQNFHPDIQTTLAGLLITSAAIDAPIVVLGHPGAGKSVLSRVLAARLCEAGFLTVHVELRRVPPNAPIQRQVEEGIEIATGEHTSWPELVRLSGDVNRVIIFDGLDELIQSSQVSRSDYLELLQEFQRREESLNRATAVVVTSRTVVAARTRFPAATVVLKLENFDDHQIAQWLTNWNDANRKYFISQKIQPLSASTALRFEFLARQPLLLTMLALYDADGNALQHQGSLETTELYERLLTSFARREIRTRDGAPADEQLLGDAVEGELQRLSITASAMFNRGRQWVSVDELNGDLTTLMQSSPWNRISGHERFNDPLSQAELTVGRFFFIHESRTAGERRRDTFEFLHATFGEYLVARFATRAILDLWERRKVAAGARALPAAFPDDGLVFALLSFEPLSTRSSIIGFIDQLLGSFDDNQAREIRSLLLRLFRQALHSSSERSYQTYHPAMRLITSRPAIYSANLLLLLVYVSEHPVKGSELFGDDADLLEEWRRLVGLWRSQFLSDESWAGYVSFFRMKKVDASNGAIELVISRAWKTGRSGEKIALARPSSPSHSGEANIDPASSAGGAWLDSGHVQHLLFLADPLMDILADIANPIIRLCPGLLTKGGAVTPATLILRVLIPPPNVDGKERKNAFNACLELFDQQADLYGVIDSECRGRILELLLDRMNIDKDYLSISFIRSFLKAVLRNDQSPVLLIKAAELLRPTGKSAERSDYLQVLRGILG